MKHKKATKIILKTHHVGNEVLAAGAPDTGHPVTKTAGKGVPATWNIRQLEDRTISQSWSMAQLVRAGAWNSKPELEHEPLAEAGGWNRLPELEHGSRAGACDS